MLEGGKIEKTISTHPIIYSDYHTVYNFTFFYDFISMGRGKKTKLEEVVVTATRVEESVEDIAQDVTVITKKEIASGSYRDISEVVRNVTGLNLFEYGNRGLSATVSLRGSTSEQALVLIDGKRLNKPGDGLVDLNAISIPLKNIERIEVLKGRLIRNLRR